MDAKGTKDSDDRNRRGEPLPCLVWCLFQNVVARVKTGALP